MSRLEKVRRVADLSVGQLTISELQRELQRRVAGLQQQREVLMGQMAEIDRQLAEIGALANGAAGGALVDAAAVAGVVGRKRMSAEEYVEAVQHSLEPGEDYTTTELADALLAKGYNAKKNTLTQGMAAWLVEEGALVDKGKRGRANLYALA